MGNHITPNVLFKIYNSQIQPILDYGAEVWYQGKAINELEVVHTGFLKKTLGVKQQTKTLAIYGECGRYPLELRQKELIVKYWCRLLKLPTENTLQIVCKKLSQLHSMNNRNWCSIVFDTLRSLGYENLLETHVEQRMTGIYSFSSKIRLSLQNSYAEYWENEIRNISKHPALRTYTLFKTIHSSELYLSLNQGWGQFLFFNSIPIPIPLRSIPIPIPIPLGWKIAIPIPIPIPFYQFQFQFQYLFINSFLIPF